MAKALDVEKKLPFIHEPKKTPLVEVGDKEDGGVIGLPRYNDITPNERIYLDQKLKDVPSIPESLAKLAQKIHTTTGKKIEDIYREIEQQNTMGFVNDNLQDLLEFNKLQKEIVPKERLALAGAMLLFRVPACRDWTEEDIGNPDLVPPKLLRLIAEFAEKERNGWATETEAETPSEEELKKISPVLDNDQ